MSVSTLKKKAQFIISDTVSSTMNTFFYLHLHFVVSDERIHQSAEFSQRMLADQNST